MRDSSEVIAGVERSSADEADGLLAAIAGAPDIATAARFLLGQCAELLGAGRGYLVMVEPPGPGDSLRVVATLALDGVPAVRPLGDHSDPVVLAALTLTPVAFSFRHDGRTTGAVAVPFPQPRAPELPRFLPGDAVGRLSADARPALTGRSGGDAELLRASLSPCGAMVFDADPDEEPLAVVVGIAEAAGPILWRIAAAEAHRRSTAQLDEQRLVLTSIVNSLPDPIVIINADHEIVVQNRRAEHLLAMGEGDSEGRRRAVEINNLLFTSHLSKNAIGAASGHGAGARELNMVDPDEGSDLLFEVLTQPLDEAEPGATVSVLRDVTDLRRAAGELERQVQRVRLAEYEAKRERDRLNLILTNVADPILVTDDRSNIILMNRQAEQLFGAATADPRDTDSEQAAVRANDTRFTSFISDFALSTDTSRREQMTLLVPNGGGRAFPVEVVSGKILDRRNETIAIVSVVHDLTEQAENERLYEELKKFSSELEARVRAATADLAEQNVRLQWQSRELEKANRLKSEFLASMSHELRTPINALIGYTALLLDRIYGELNPRQEEGLTRIQAAAQHLLALINDILDLAKIEAGRMPLHLDDVVLQDIVREVTVQLDPLVKKKGLGFRVAQLSAPIRMHTDRTKVKQIMLNLLSNAVKFTQAGDVTLQAHAEGDSVRIDVVDTGIGIRQQDLDAIWEDFRQVDQSRTREFGGTGLGLSITRKLVEALGGRVTLTSQFGEGSTFSVFLPLDSRGRGDGPDAPEGEG